MNITVYPGRLSGSVRVPCSKSYAHRLLICAALADGVSFVGVDALNDDIKATARCLRALGADIEYTGEGYRVSPVPRNIPLPAELDCGESGSTLRFLIPVAAALGRDTRLIGHGRLPERPNKPLTDALRAHGIEADSDLLPMELRGKLRGGRYEIAGNISSQYITGLMLALPLCGEDSEIALTTALESAAYIDITTECLKAFGICVERTATGWHIPDGQKYAARKRIDAEGDWSGASFWLAARAIGSDVHCEGLNPESVQGDRAMLKLLNGLGGELDVSGTPDLVPPLAVAAALHPGITRITGAARLRLKESDRLKTVAEMLTALGAEVTELRDGLVIRGCGGFKGGTVNGCNDHRIVMSAAIAATRAEAPVTVTDAQAVNKSYPVFFDAFAALGGRLSREED